MLSSTSQAQAISKDDNQLTQVAQNKDSDCKNSPKAATKTLYRAANNDASTLSGQKKFGQDEQLAGMKRTNK